MYNQNKFPFPTKLSHKFPFPFLSDQSFKVPGILSVSVCRACSREYLPFLFFSFLLYHLSPLSFPSLPSL
ncbi:hypothetical protein EUGRSUZ_F03850 [Eucalyptus grandis]|uniref:Uncharacterized protein n=2 Tax=Eucalyptus grandis TaxID=71139 RepID=A0ACC3KNF3_EUCGR|nr:hypothetical protein EUGRSUZ_F03850 [Eucalyptus grandis]